MFIGVDVRPHRVDAVLLDGAVVRAAASVPAGGSRAVAAALAALAETDPEAADARAVSVTRSTPQSALVSPGRLAPTTCLRLCDVAADTAPPMTGWPAALRAAIGDDIHLCPGGHAFDGRPTAQLDLAELGRIAADLRDRSIRTAAVTSVFAPVNNADEVAAAAFLTERVPGLRVSLSHEIGTIGLFERENATILNAALRQDAERVAEETVSQVRRVVPGAEVYLAQNDGTVMEMSFGRRYPVLALWPTAACTIHGAALLAGLGECVVAEVDGSRLTVGVAQGGFARQRPEDTQVGGVPVSLRRAETVVRDLEPDALEATVRVVDPSRALPLVLVGPDADRVPGTVVAVRPEAAAVAGAVGAARTRIGGTVDRIVSGDPAARAAAADDAAELALQRAVLAGALDSSVRLVETEEIPLGYLPGDFVRLRVRAVGGLD